MVEDPKQTNVHEDLEDLLAEVADAHLPGYSGSTAQPGAQNDDTAGLTAAQKKRRKKNKKKKELKQMQQMEAGGNAATRNRHEMTQEEAMAESKRRHMTPLREKLGDSFYEDTDSSEDEGLPDYKFGGYHPMHVGEVLVNRYLIIQKLGWGHFSTVWLAKDIQYNTFVALKIQRSASHYLVAAFDEVEILDQVASYWMKPEWLGALKKYYKNEPEKLKNITGNDCSCVQLLNCFLHHGAHGKHFVMVFEILGVNLLEVIKRYNYKGVPMPLVRIMAKQCLMGLDYLHRVCQIIHTDLKPENVNLCLTEQEVEEIASRGQLTTTKMFELPEDLKKICAGKIIPGKETVVVNPVGEANAIQQQQSDQGRGRMAQKEDEDTQMDKGAKRAAKKRRQKERKRLEKLEEEKKQKEEEEKQAALEEASYASRPKTAKFSKKGAAMLKRQNESGSKRNSIYGQDSAQMREAQHQAAHWGLRNLDEEQIMILNDKLDEYQEMPRNMSEPRMKYMPSPDLRPEALEEADEGQRQILIQQMKQIQETGETPVGHYSFDFNKYQTDRMKLNQFIEYRQQFEQSQQVRIQNKLQDLDDSKAGKRGADQEEDSDDELGAVLGIPYLKFDLLDPRQIKHEIEEDKAKRRGPKLGEDLKLKICDLGNGCWTYHHFSTEIQTRQYRSPEVIIGAKYGTSADLWSFACMIFEMATGDFLFEPRKGDKYGKNDDHLAQMMELLGRMPQSMALSGLRSRKYFQSAGHLRHIRGLNFWPLKKVLQEKYKFNETEAQAFTDFLVPMLVWDPDRRASAETMLDHPWLSMPNNYETRITPAEREQLVQKQRLAQERGEPLDLETGDAAVQYYHNAEMSKLTDSEGEYWPADDEWVPKRGSKAQTSTAPTSSNMDRLNSFLDNELDSDDSGFFFSDEEDEKVIKSKKTVQRDLAEGQNLNNSFGCYSPEDWEHLHVDKGANPQFKLINNPVAAKQSKVQLPNASPRVQKNNFM